MADDDHVKDIAIYKAALHDDWNSVSKMFKDNPSLMTKRITQVGDTPLHIAVGTNSSNDFVEKLVQCIVDKGEREIEKLFEKNAYGNNPLHVAAMVGNMHATQLLLKYNPDKTQTLVPNKDRSMPLQLAAWHGNKETLKYLLKVTPKPDEKKGINPYTDEAGEPDEEKGISPYIGEAGEPDGELDEEKGISSYIGEAGEPDEEKGLSSYTGEAGEPDEEKGLSSYTGEAGEPDEEKGISSYTGEAGEPEEEKGINPYTGEAGEPDEEKGISSYTREAGEPDEEKGISPCTGETREPDKEKGISPYTREAGGNLITRTIMAGFYDVALDIIKKHPYIVFEKDSSKESPKTALEILAQKPESFASGRRLGLWGRFIYSLIPVKNNEGTTDHSKYIAGFWNALGYVVPTVKMIYDMKVNDNRINLLIKLICKVVIKKGNHKTAWKILGSAIVTAVKYGVHELIEECILTYPFIIWYGDNEYRLPNQDQDQDPQPYKFNLFLEAIRHRQERVFNLVYQMSHHKVFAATQHDGKENALHIAGKLAPTHRLHVVTGAALQMQRELQWFQEVQKFITQLSYEEDLNNDKKTPRMLFSDEHKQLLIEGQQWMKDTASSCTVVAALIVTMAFAAAFTLPGGNQDDGIPMFLNFNTFMLFIISDAVALFSSSTSVLMFLGILTSRYAEADFLYALPKRLTIGLISLFISLAATMIAFSSALALMLKYKVTWIAAPLIIATSIPVCLFGLLQFPLLVELVKSTYGKSIFHQQNAQMIH